MCLIGSLFPSLPPFPPPPRLLPEQHTHSAFKPWHTFAAFHGIPMNIVARNNGAFCFRPTISRWMILFQIFGLVPIKVLVVLHFPIRQYLMHPFSCCANPFSLIRPLSGTMNTHTHTHMRQQRQSTHSDGLRGKNCLSDNGGS